MAAIVCASQGELSGQVIRAPEVRSLRFIGNESFSDRDLRAVIQTRSTGCVSFLLNPVCLVTDWGFAHRRGYLDSLDVAGDELRLRSFYTLRGFFDATVQSDIRTIGHDARVAFTVTEGEPTPIDSFVIRGLPDVIDVNSAQEMIGVEVGERFDPT